MIVFSLSGHGRDFCAPKDLSSQKRQKLIEPTMFHARNARSLLSSVARQNNKNYDVAVFQSRRTWMNITQPLSGANITAASTGRRFMVVASGLAIAGGITVRQKSKSIRTPDEECV